MSGYIGNAPVPQATQTRQTFTATSGQTSFATAGYVAGGQFIQVYLNGVLLKLTDDYTAANGSDIILTSGAATGDILEFISFADFTVNNQNFTGGLTVDNDGSTVLTVDRATSDGTIIDLQKSGSSVGSIGNSGGDVYFRKSSYAGVYCSSTGVLPFGAHSLGQASDRWSDLYLSGGVYLGGTGAANKLDDYEEGTWTPAIRGQGTAGSYTLSQATGTYTKIGGFVYLSMRVVVSSVVSAGTSYMQITGLPFTKANNAQLNDSAVRLRNTTGVPTFNWPCLEMVSGGSTNVAYIFCNQINGSGFDMPVSSVQANTEFSGHLFFEVA